MERKAPGLADLAAQLAGEKTSSAEILRNLADAVRRLDRKGPMLAAILAANPQAGREAKRLDKEREIAGPRGPLHGLPILIKDNIETADPVATTAGSLALEDHFARRDAPIVARLKAAGAIVQAKANLSEWANFRSPRSLSGWSALGGQCRNAHDQQRSPSGSSSGSAVAVAAGLAAAAIGTETDGSIVSPAAANGIVGIKPTVGLCSRSGVIPISASQDTPGPMTRTVADAAALLAVMAGSDPSDPATKDADRLRADYPALLDADALKGAKIGVLRFCAGFHGPTDQRFEEGLALMRRKGASLSELAAGPDRKALGKAEQAILLGDFKRDLEAWLATTNPGKVAPRSLEGLIGFNRKHAAQEMAIFGQELFEAALAAPPPGSADYRKAQRTCARLSRKEGLDLLLEGVDALVAPTDAPAWLIDPILGDHRPGGRAASLPAIAGYPHLTVPMGEVAGLPVGLSFIGPAWAEGRLLALGHAFERARARA